VTRSPAFSNSNAAIGAREDCQFIWTAAIPRWRDRFKSADVSAHSKAPLGSDRLKAGEHFFGFSESFQWNAIADREELVPHREHVWILVRGIDRFVRFPFRHFDDRAVARPHHRCLAIRHQIFVAQSRHATAHKLEQLLFFSRFRSIGDDDNYAFHKIDVDSNLSGKQKNRNRITGSKNRNVISQWSIVTLSGYR